MLLKDWLKKENMTTYHLAKKLLNCSTGYLYGHINHNKKISAKVAARIEEVTKGEVTRLEVIYPQDFMEKKGESEQLTFINKMGEG